MTHASKQDRVCICFDLVQHSLWQVFKLSVANASEDLDKKVISLYSLLECTEPGLMIFAVAILAFKGLKAFYQSIQSFPQSVCYSMFHTVSFAHRNKVQSIRDLLHLEGQLCHVRAFRDHKVIP